MNLFPTNRTPPSTSRAIPSVPLHLNSSGRGGLPDRLLPQSNRFVQFPVDSSSSTSLPSTKSINSANAIIPPWHQDKSRESGNEDSQSLNSLLNSLTSGLSSTKTSTLPSDRPKVPFDGGLRDLISRPVEIGVNSVDTTPSEPSSSLFSDAFSGMSNPLSSILGNPLGQGQSGAVTSQMNSFSNFPSSGNIPSYRSNTSNAPGRNDNDMMLSNFLNSFPVNNGAPIASSGLSTSPWSNNTLPTTLTTNNASMASHFSTSSNNYSGNSNNFGDFGNTNNSFGGIRNFAPFVNPALHSTHTSLQKTTDKFPSITNSLLSSAKGGFNSNNNDNFPLPFLRPDQFRQNPPDQSINPISIDSE